MLSATENDRLTQVGPGTPMGELMRRYWHPVAAAAELDERPTKQVRLLGENLVLYKDKSGALGLIDRLCAHRRVDLSYGIPEEHGLRCMYHGWMYDETGQCIEQPFEETVHPDGRFKEKVKLAGYPVEEQGGMVFAYMGPLPVPFMPQWETFGWTNAVFEIAMTNLPCNWLQCMENSLDPIHVEWLHRFYTFHQNVLEGDLLATIPPRIPHAEIGFDVFKHGIIKRRVLEGYDKEWDDWKIGHPILFPNILFVGGNGIGKTLQYRVPVDDENTLHVTFYAWQGAPGTQLPKQESIPYKYVPLYNEAGEFNVKYTIDQDKMAWATQGAIAQRSKEMLGKSDVGIILYRKLLSEQMRVAADGGEPMNVFKDRAEAEGVRIPTEKVALGRDRVKRVRYLPLEGGLSGIAELATVAVDSWFEDEVPVTP